MRLLNLKFTYESSKKSVAFLDLVSLDNGSILEIYALRVQIVINNSIVVPHIQIK